MVLGTGDKIHVIVRRRFEGDLRRHFAGEVSFVEEGVARVEGYAFVYNSARKEFVRRPEKRTRLVSLLDGGNLINLLPGSVEIKSLSYRLDGNRLVLTDGESFRMDINEFGAHR